jgi:hypothetical protein
MQVQALTDDPAQAYETKPGDKDEKPGDDDEDEDK